MGRYYGDGKVMGKAPPTWDHTYQLKLFMPIICCVEHICRVGPYVGDEWYGCAI